MFFVLFFYQLVYLHLVYNKWQDRVRVSDRMSLQAQFEKHEFLCYDVKGDNHLLVCKLILL